MPYKSKAQQRFFNAFMPKAMAHKWNEATKRAKGGFKGLPNKVKRKKRK